MTDLTNDREVAALLKKLPDDSGFPDPFDGMKTPAQKVKKLYRVHVRAEIVEVFEVEAESPDDAAMETYSKEPIAHRWVTAGNVVAIEEKTPSGWKAATPEEAAVVEAIE